MTSSPLLSVRNLTGGYGDTQVLFGMAFDVNEGEVVTLLGRNGAGKTSTMKAITGLLSKRSGSIDFEGSETISLAPHHIGRLGLGYCPEERGIYGGLSVMENLLLPPVIRSGGLTTEQVLELFPRLRERARSKGTNLSGGEQQMLAIARILRTGARLLLLDEPTEGLAPVIVQQIGEIISKLRDRGYTILLVEQNFRFASTVADRHYVVEHGQVIDSLTAAEVTSRQSHIQQLLGV
ncbi:ABC transporter ATP-binding protein [uncultured Roseibium sp.]|uniref:ABC transporter ATP-binding protein n=1 Tax=uncultured Roseibium sp. TaxID=1936171 RepID=UPI0032169665